MAAKVHSKIEGTDVIIDCGKQGPTTSIHSSECTQLRGLISVMNSVVNVLHGPLEYADAPFWYSKTNSLYYVNVYQSEIHKYNPETRQHTFAKVGKKPLAFAIPIVDFNDKFLVGYGNDIGAITWDGVSNNISEVKILETVKTNPGRISDGKVSPSGVLFVGTSGIGNFHTKNLDIGKGSLFNCPNCTLKELLPNIGVANGMAWGREEKTFYFIDSSEYRIEKYSWDKNNNELINGCVLYEFKDDNLAGYPCGMTIDRDEHLWIACFDGGQVIRLNPKTGKIARKIEIPHSPRVTSVAFGGKNEDTLFVTTAAYGTEGAQKNAGYIFQITGIGTTGPVNLAFRLLT